MNECGPDETGDTLHVFGNIDPPRRGTTVRCRCGAVTVHRETSGWIRIRTAALVGSSS